MLFYLDNWLSADPKAAEQVQQQVEQPPARAIRRRRHHPPPATAATATAETAAGTAAQRPQRKLRARADGAAHARRGRRLHAAGHHRSGARVHGLDAGESAGTATSASRRSCTTAARRRCSATPSRLVAASKTASACSTSSPSIRRRRDTSQRKLVRRFVSDEPPAALVDKVAATFTKTKGDLREVVRTLVTSPEFYAAEYRGAKVKTPLEFVVSGVRATGREVREPRQLLQALQQLGMAPYQCQPPTGLRRHRGNVGVGGRARHAHEHRAAVGAAARGANRRPGLPASLARGDSHDSHDASS